MIFSTINYQMFVTKCPTKWNKARVPEQMEFKNITPYLTHKITDPKVQQDLNLMHPKSFIMS